MYRIAYSAVGHFFAIGEANRLHYLRCGVSANKITYARYCVTDRWTGINDPKRLLVRAQVRKELGIDDHRQVLLFSGKLQYKKNPECIIEALMLMSEEAMRRFAIVYMGSGECNDELRRLAYNVPHVPVIFIGFKNQLELEKYYLCGDVLILPSRQMGETWGLVVNEALLAGLRVVVSRHVGCVGDFGHFPSVRVFDGTPEGLAIVLSDLPDRSAVEQNRKLLEDYSVSRAAEAIVRRGQWERIVHRTIV
ncbi:MAG TPA: glycosyltransferase [Tepidisphaeraceae bacterium]|nr:glycosyltransferase [Tepidisphaeraceae bacterium]